MSKKVIKGWDITNAVSIPEWQHEGRNSRMDTNMELELGVIYKNKGTKKDADHYGYDWPPRKVTITIEIED